MGFYVHLVDATTGMPLQERTDANGAVWVKGEPGDEFFVLVEQDARGGPACDVSASIKVDGASLGYRPVWKRENLPFTSNLLGPAKTGQLSTDSDMVTHAFKFLRHETTQNGDDDDDRGEPTTGSVVVTFRRAVFSDEMRKNVTTVSEWVGSDEAVVASNKKEQVALRAGVGSVPSRICVRPTVVRAHEVLETVTVRYTTDFGIAVRGLYTPDEVNMPSSSSPARKRVKKAAGGMSEDDAIVL